MKRLLVDIMGILLMITPVKLSQDYIMNEYPVTMEDLEIRDLTEEEKEAIKQIDVLMDELFDSTWEVIE